MAPQVIEADHPPPPDENRGNIFSFLQSNPFQVDLDRAAFVGASPHAGGATPVLTRRRLFDDARRLAHALRHRLGLTPGRRMGVVSPNSLLYPVVVYAGLCAGLELVPLNPAYSAQELLHPFLDAQVDYLFVHPTAAREVRGALELARLGATTPLGGGQPRVWTMSDDGYCVPNHGPSSASSSSSSGATGPPDGEPDVKTLMGEARLEPHAVTRPEETVAFVAYSSGTSGKPKGVMLTHSNMTSVTASLHIAMLRDATPSDVQLAVLPFQHIFALAKFMHHAVYVGSTVVVMPRFELEAWCEAVQRHRVTIGIVVPPILVQLAKSPVTSRYDLSSLKYFLCGAAPLSKELGEEVEQRIPGVRCCQGYGLTETSPTATYGSYLEYHHHPGSAGKLIPGVSLRLVTDDGRDVGHAQGKAREGREGEPEAGEVWIKGRTVMKGYLNNPEATRECITEDGWFKTGDVGVVKKGYLYIVDRKKELIKYKGYQVAPAELEALLLTHPRVADAACVGLYVADEATEVPVAFVVPRPTTEGGGGGGDSSAAFADEVRRWVDGRVANHKRLRGGVRCVEAIPKSPSGKILRRMLRDRLAAETEAKTKTAKTTAAGGAREDGTVGDVGGPSGPRGGRGRGAKL